MCRMLNGLHSSPSIHQYYMSVKLMPGYVQRERAREEGGRGGGAEREREHLSAYRSKLHTICSNCTAHTTELCHWPSAYGSWSKPLLIPMLGA